MVKSVPGRSAAVPSAGMVTSSSLSVSGLVNVMMYVRVSPSRSVPGSEPYFMPSVFPAGNLYTAPEPWLEGGARVGWLLGPVRC